MHSKGSIPIHPRWEDPQEKYSSLSTLEKFNPHILAGKTDSNSRKLLAPTLQLSGHQAEVFCVKFAPNGEILATAGFDKNILLWQIFKECKNIAMLKGHTNAILQLNWSTDGSHLFSCSADKSIGIWDSETGKREKKLKGHSSIVNSVHSARRGLETLVSGSEDGTVRIWDLRTRESVSAFNLGFPITAVSFNDTAEKVFFGGLENNIHSLDLRKGEVEYTLEGHSDTITGISLSHEGSYLLSNSADQTIRCWDIRPFVLGNRCLKIFQGATHNQEKNLLRVDWSPNGQMVTGGSADCILNIWDTANRKILHRLSGHNGAINEATFSPKDNLIATASSDKSVIIGEIPDVTL